MIQKITHVLLLVRDQQEALAWFTEKLGFVVKANDPFPGQPEHTWITVAPEDQTELEIVLQPPLWGSEGSPDEREQLIGKQPGFVMITDDCRGECERLKDRGVNVVDEPMEMLGAYRLFSRTFTAMCIISWSRERDKGRIFRKLLAVEYPDC